MVASVPSLIKPSTKKRSNRLDDAIAYYDENASTLAARYEALVFDQVHQPIIKYLPRAPAILMDVGAGSGRDAAALARRGYTVVAVEPSTELRKIGRKLHRTSRIQWVDDSLPNLDRIAEKTRRFDAILCSAVWMHLDLAGQKLAMSRLSNFLKPSGHLFITFRARFDADRPEVYETTAKEVIEQADNSGLQLLEQASLPDAFSRKGATWCSLVFQAPDQYRR